MVGGAAGWRGAVLQMVLAVGLLAAALFIKKKREKRPTAAVSCSIQAVERAAFWRITTVNSHLIKRSDAVMKARQLV